MIFVTGAEGSVGHKIMENHRIADQNRTENEWNRFIKIKKKERV